jgi:hypothetical protein
MTDAEKQAQAKEVKEVKEAKQSESKRGEAKTSELKTESVKLNPKRNSKGAEYICQWLEGEEPKSISVGFEPVDVPESSQQLQEGLNNQTLIRA